MYRYKIEELKKWKNSEDRKPLILKGARQVGKTWLIDSGLIYQINRVKDCKIPLSAYQDFSAFKLYLLDVGLLCAKAEKV